MTITLFQMNPVWQSPSENLFKVENIIPLLAEPRGMLILPEMFNTAYTMHPEIYAENINGNTISKLAKWAKEFDIVLCGSVPIAKNNSFTNDFIVIQGDSLKFQYSKVHLFGLAGESDHYVSGNKILDFTIDHIKFRPLICYDLRFPYLSFNNTDYDILICVANWPLNRIEHWRALLKARAIENQCYAIGVNRVGSDALGYKYPGSSMVFDYYGNVLLDLGDQECFMSFEPDLEAMYNYREKFPFIKDQKPANYFKNS